MEQNQHNNSSLNKASASQRPQDTIHIKGKYEIILNWYKVNGKNLLDEEILTGLQISTLLKILGNPIWNDIYHCWAVEAKHIPNLQAYVQHQFNPDKFTYFIEAYHNQ